MLNLDVRHFELIAAVTDEGSLTKAGERLNLSQSALSCQLKEAERRLGRKLFERAGKKMVLTPAGARMLQAARCVLREIREAERDLDSLHHAPLASVRVATECFTCYTWLPSVLQRLSERTPEIEVIIAAEHTRNPGPALLRGDLDVGIVTRTNAHRRLQLTPLFPDEMIAAVPIGHKLASCKWVDATHLQHEHVVTYDAPRSELTLFTDIMDPAGLVPRRHSRIQLTEAMIELVKAGMAIAILPRWLVVTHAASAHMRAVRLTRKGIRREWCAATLRGPSVPPHVIEFTGLLSELVQMGALFA